MRIRAQLLRRLGVAARRGAGRRRGAGPPPCVAAGWTVGLEVRASEPSERGATPAPTPATITVAATATAFDQAAAIGSETGTIRSAREARAQEGRERQERGDALDDARRSGLRASDGGVEPGGDGLAAARLAVGDVAREAARVAGAERGLAGRWR